MGAIEQLQDELYHTVKELSMYNDVLNNYEFLEKNPDISAIIDDLNLKRFNLISIMDRLLIEEQN